MAENVATADEHVQDRYLLALRRFRLIAGAR